MTNRIQHWIAIAGVAWLCTAGGAFAADAKPAGAKTTYDQHVKPILREHCFSCHNANKTEGDLALDTFAKTMAGGSGGEVITPGDADGSRLWALVSHADTPKMPPEQPKLVEAKLAVIRKWIAGGALENAGSKAAIKKKPSHALTVPANSGKPEGPPPMPEKLWRQPVVYTSRAAAVTALTTSPWAPLAAVAGQRQIALYHTDEARLLGVLPFPEGIAQVLRFSRNGSLLIAGGGRNAATGVVVVYDVKTGRRVMSVGDELDTVFGADIDSAQSMIALGGPQRMLRVYSTADGSLRYEIKKHTDWIYAVEFSPDGVLLASADRAGGVHLWEAETGQPYMTLAGHKAPVHAISWRADSNVLATASEDRTVKLWEIKGGKQIRSLSVGSPVTGAQFLRDGRLVTTARNNQTRLWKADGNAERTFEALPDNGLEVAATHDGARVIAGDWAGNVRMYNSADGKRLADLPSNPPTLEMLVKQTRDAANARKAELEKFRAAVVAAEAQAKAKADAVTQAQQAVTVATAQRNKAQGEMTAAKRNTAAARGMVTQADQKLRAANQAVAKLDVEIKQTTAQVASHKKAKEQADKARAAGQQDATQKTTAAQQAEKLAQQRKAAIAPAEATAKTAAERAAQIEAQRKQLEQLLAKTPAEEKAAIEKQLNNKTAELAQARDAEQKAKMAADETKKQSAAANQQLAAARAAQAEAQKKLAALDGQAKQAAANLAASEKQFADKTNARKQSSTQAQQTQQSISAAKQKIQTEEQRRQQAQKAIAAADQRLPGLKTNVQEMAKQKAAADKLLAERRAAATAAEQRAAAAEAIANGVVAEQAEFAKLPTQLAAAVNVQNAKVAEVKKAADAAVAAQQQAKQQVDQAMAPLKEMEAKIAALTAELTKLKQGLKPHQDNLAAKSAAATAASQQAAAAQTELDKALAAQKQFAETYGKASSSQ